MLGIARCATTVLFLVFGCWVGVWVSAIPGLKEAFRLDARQLGVVIFLSGIGNLGMAIPIGRLIDKMGPKFIMINSGFVSLLLYMWLPWMARHGWSPYTAIFCLSTYSAGGAVAANHRATELEILWEKPIMSSFHAAFSVGGVVGSATYAALLGRGLTWDQAYPALALVMAFVNLIAASFMDWGMTRFSFPEDHHVMSPSQVLFEAITSPRAARQKPLISTLNLTILCLGCVCFLTMMTEGAVGDWSALYFIETVGAAPSRAPLGYSVYATAMGALRFLGDELIGLYGRRKVFRFGAMTAMTGTALLIGVPSFKVGLAACALMGMGMSNMMPILMSTAGRMAKGNSGVLIATLVVCGNCGLMGGPCIIGFIAKALHSLRIGLLTIVATTTLIMLATPVVKEIAPTPRAVSPAKRPLIVSCEEEL